MTSEMPDEEDGGTEAAAEAPAEPAPAQEAPKQSVTVEVMRPEPEQDRVLIVDFGSQVTQLIVRRVRSISGNIVVGAGNAEEGPMDPAYLHVKKTSDLVVPGPAESWVFVDEHPDSINDAGLFSPYITEWVDLPASYHGGACGFAFADGHSEIHKWRSGTTLVPVRLIDLGHIPVKANDPDIQWMRYHTPRKPGQS